MTLKTNNIVHFPAQFRADDEIHIDWDEFLDAHRMLMTARLSALLAVWRTRDAEQYGEQCRVLASFVAGYRDDYGTLVEWFEAGSGKGCAAWDVCRVELEAVIGDG